ncbi:MAG: S-layer homology domain-containing protein, partial [Acidimicrobiia bacterium]
TDDDGTVFEADINALATAGITSGCGPERYCPDGVITRAEMAAFLSRASSLPPSAQNYFSDDDGSIFEPDINTVAAAEITEGCGQSFYCPHDYVTRAQMASFLVRAIP